MVSHMKRSFTGAAVAGIAAFLSVSLGCDKVPLLAPSGSVISLFAAEMVKEDPFHLWRGMGLPSYIVIDWDQRKAIQIVHRLSQEN